MLDEAAPPAKKGEAAVMKKVIRIPVVEAQKMILKELQVAPPPVPSV